MDDQMEVRNLSIYFQSKIQAIRAVDNLNFSLMPGRTTALLGESGCGKSLTALALLRLLPQDAGYGRQSAIFINKTDILDLPESMMRAFRGQKIAMIFQEPMTALNPVLTIGAQLKEAILAHQQISKTSLDQRMLALLNEVELDNPVIRLSQFPHQLSGGQKQRILIAMALAHSPDILIADEPTTALDVTIQAQILGLLKKLQRERGMCLLLITHDLGVVRIMANQVCVMYAGQLVEVSDVKAFFDKPLHPYTQQLLASLPNFTKRSVPLHSIPGQVPHIDAFPSGCRFHPRCAHVFSICPLIEPEIQRCSDRQVRCHLYPEIEKLPELPVGYLKTPSNFHSPQTSLPQTGDASGVVLKNPILTVQNLSVHFYIGKRFLRSGKVVKAVDHLSFSIETGKTLALVGESGCGKTTVLRAILRLIPIQNGHIALQSRDIASMRGAELLAYRQKVQVVFQDPYASLNPRMTVAQILEEGMHAQGFSRAYRIKRCNALVDQVNLPSASLGRYPHQFSGGQRQRIGIARALAVNPQLIICDEPTSALDVSVQAQILNLLKVLQNELRVSYLFITHNMSVVSYLAHDVLVMKQGQCVEQGTCEQILFHPQHDYTKRLLASVLI